jgi:colanic acid biosynthesis glycosyl transferase WcaI
MARISIVSQWYPPEQAPFGKMMEELASFLAAHGWQVTVITGFPNHPSGTVHPGYSKRWLSEERVNGVRVCRVWLATSPRRSLLARLATFVSFTLAASWRLLREPRADILFAVLQPLSVGFTLPLLARWKRTALVFNVQDLHPDAQISMGLIRNPLLIRALRALETHAYRNCAALSVICETFRRHAVARGAAEASVHVIENWIDTQRISPRPEAGLAFRREHGIDAADFVVLWAGTLGHASAAEIVVDAASCLRDVPRLRFLVVGEGPLAASLRQRADAAQLSNVTFRDFQPEEQLAAMQSSADVSLVTLAASFASVSVPSKVLAYLAAGRPVVACVPEESETAALIRRADAGVVVPAGDRQALAHAIRALALDAAEVRRLGERARSYAVAHLSRTVAMGRYEAMFARMVPKP